MRAARQIVAPAVQVTLADGTVVNLRAPSYAVEAPAYGPPHPQLQTSPRVAPQMIGLGLIETIPVADIVAAEHRLRAAGANIGAARAATGTAGTAGAAGGVARPHTRAAVASARTGASCVSQRTARARRAGTAAEAGDTAGAAGAALAAGATDNGPPGLRWYHPHYYGAFIRDPDGQNIEAVCHAPA